MGLLIVRNTLILAWTPIAAKNPRQIPHGEKAFTSAKDFGNWALSQAKCLLCEQRGNCAEPGRRDRQRGRGW